MGLPEILEKLQYEIQKNITEESQVVYILSRIRKYLEIKNLKGNYKYLNFYCNWALHSKIDRTEPVVEILRDFNNGTDEGKFLKFGYFYDDLKSFLDNEGLNSSTLLEKNNYLIFINLLLDILSDTPVEFYSDDKKEIIINKPKIPIKDSLFNIEFSIRPKNKNSRTSIE